MNHWTQPSIPVVYIRSFCIIEPPLLKLLCPEGTKVVDNTFPLLPDHQPFYGLGVSELAAIIYVVVKACIKFGKDMRRERKDEAVGTKDNVP